MSGVPDEGSMAGRRQGKKVIQVLVLLLVSILLPILLLEGALRIYPKLISEPVLLEFPKALRREVAARLGLPLKQARRCIASEDRDDHGPELCLAYPDFQWVQKVDAIDRQYGAREQIPQDGNGFCNTRHKAERSQQDIVFIGDSFTWCTSVAPDKTFPALLENSSGATTYNLGFPGVGPYEYVEILKRFGLQYAPRLVVMSVYEGNDLRDGERYWKNVNEKRGRAADRSERKYDRQDHKVWSKRLLNNSYALSFISASIEDSGKRFFSDGVDFRYRVSVGGNEVPMNVANADRDEVKSARRLRTGKAYTSVLRDALVEFIHLAKKHHFRPVVTYIPSAHTAYAASVAFQDSSVGEDVAYLSARQRTYLLQLSDELGFTYIDLTEPLQQTVVTGTLAYFPGNVHLSERGHILIADILTPLLTTMVRSVPLGAN